MDIIVNYAEVEAAAARLTTAQHDITTQLRALGQMIEQLTSVSFKTDVASGRFHESFVQWSGGASNVINGLEGMSKALHAAVKAHQELDRNLGHVPNN